MGRVSAKKVRKDIFLKITEQFTNSVVHIKNDRESRRFLSELLTDSEKIMLAKRFALLMMLEDGYSFTAIRKSLKMSQSTVVNFWKLLQRGKFSFLRAMIKKEKERKEFWNKLEKVINAGLPPRGRGRWRNVYRLFR